MYILQKRCKRRVTDFAKSETHALVISPKGIRQVSYQLIHEIIEDTSPELEKMLPNPPNA